MLSPYARSNGALEGQEGWLGSMIELGFAKVDDQGGCRTKIVDDQGGCRTKLEFTILIFMPKYTYENGIFFRQVDKKCSITQA